MAYLSSASIIARRVATQPSLRCGVAGAARLPAAPRPYSTRLHDKDVKGSANPRKHATDAEKDDRMSIITDEVGKGKDERNAKEGVKDGTASQATTDRDQTSSAKRAKEEFPESPTGGMGMQDERGRKGH